MYRYISKDVLQNVLQTSGTKTILLKAKSGNEKGYFGTKEITVKVRGTKLQKKFLAATFSGVRFFAEMLLWFVISERI